MGKRSLRYLMSFGWVFAHVNLSLTEEKFYCSAVDLSWLRRLNNVVNYFYLINFVLRLKIDTSQWLSFSKSIEQLLRLFDEKCLRSL